VKETEPFKALTNCGIHFPEVNNISNAEGTYTTESRDEIYVGVYINH